MKTDQKILITGVTGYVGTKLLRELEGLGYPINCLARDPQKMRPVGNKTTVYRGDLLVRSSLKRAFQGIDTAYYLVHFLNEKKDYVSLELQAAENFAAMAREAGVKRIIYVGGLGNERDGLSSHLQSRQDVGYTLRHSGIPTVELRASIILGEGSLSFGMIKDLTEHLPFMVMPKWVSMKAQPIGIQDLLGYLIQSLDIPLETSRVVEIGGSDQLSYRDLMREYANQRGLKRLMIPVPVLTPWLSSHWLSLFTSVNSAIGRKLIEGVKNPTIVENTLAKELFDIRPGSAADAIREAIRETDIDFADAAHPLLHPIPHATHH